MAPQIRRSSGDLVLDAKFPPSKRCRVGSERDPPPPRPPIGKLGDDLLEEILIRSFQNPRCAGRCALVCKRWSALTSCPRFNRRFISHHEPPPQPLLLPSDDPNSVLCFLPLPQKARTKLSVSDCFKDLVLCRFEEESVYAELDRLYLLCNPFTEQWVVLPLAPSRDKGSGRADAKLVCQPRSVCNIELGDGQVFAYSPNYRFRVVCIYQLDMSIRLDMFCSESGEWSQMLMKDRVRLPSYDAVSRNGELFLAYVEDQTKYTLAAIDPFRLDRSNDGPIL
ncbi:unnamed protein product [Linum tenue]|uniref:F-box domain-containing protein n=1 Tax=Linum tenue TaxID=586396 RepID=A0AAV0JRG0_9ROSI|nr:unnamed protein product [Linum tenue]